MAEQNIKMNVKTDTGYDTLYPQTKGSIVDFNKSGSNLGATNVDSAIKEVNTKADGRIEKTKILGTLNEVKINSQKGFVPDATVLNDLVANTICEAGEYSIFPNMYSSLALRTDNMPNNIGLKSIAIRDVPSMPNYYTNYLEVPRAGMYRIAGVVFFGSIGVDRANPVDIHIKVDISRPDGYKTNLNPLHLEPCHNYRSMSFSYVTRLDKGDRISIGVYQNRKEMTIHSNVQITYFAN